MTGHEDSTTFSGASVDAAIEGRFSCRAFLKGKLVTRDTIEQILGVACHAPSGTNAQPWKVYVVMNAGRDALSERVCAAHEEVRANPAAAATYKEDFNYYPESLTSPFIERKRQNGWALYGVLGIAKGEKDRMHAQQQRNYQFFNAPVGLMFTAARCMGTGAIMDTAMLMQNVMTAAHARGLHTCPQAAWLNYGMIVRDHLGIAQGEILLSGMSLGYADPAAPVNTLRTPREPLESFVHWRE